MANNQLPASPVRDDLRLWAAEQLQLPPGASPAEAEQAFVRRLEDDDFVPFELCHDAWQVLSQGAGRMPSAGKPALSGGGRGFSEDVEPLLHEEVEQFARDYFDLPAADRRRQWQQLTARCLGFPALEHRLSQLERGLEIEIADWSELQGTFQKLASDVCQLYTMCPAQRALCRHSLIQEKSTESYWGDDAWRFQSTHSQLAMLAPDYLHRLVGQKRHQKELAKARQKATRRNPPRETVVRSSGSGSEFWGLPYWAIPVIIVILLSLVRNAAKPPPQGRAAPTPQWSQPTLSPKDQAAIWRALADPAQRKQNETLRRLLGMPEPPAEEPSDEAPPSAGPYEIPDWPLRPLDAVP